MREPKYQAWHKANKKMYRVVVLYLGAKERGVTLTEGNGPFITCPLDEVELREFTGLKDKAGKEIYEGDIVRYTHPEEYGLPGFTSIETIAWGEEVMGFNLGVISHHLTIYDELEVIGNIYENPDLIPPA